MRRDVFAVGGVRAPRTEISKPSPKHGDGAVCVRWVRCGRVWCRCMKGGPKHGPYFAQFWWQDGRRYKRYVRKDEAEAMVTACSDRRVGERRERARAEAAHQEWRQLRALIREIERGER